MMQNSICRAHLAPPSGRAAARVVAGPSKKPAYAPRATPCFARRAPKARQQRACSAAAAGGDAPGEMSELQRIQANDQLLDLLLACKSQEELAKTVADNILSFDQKFWLRLAARSDTAPDEDTKAKLGSLAGVIMQIVNELVKASEGQLEESSNVLQDILVSAADEKGEWSVPLPQAQMQAMEKAVEENADKIDEAVLSNAFAWMRKANEDKLDGMVALLQQVLQLWAARALMVPNPQKKEAEVFNQMLEAGESSWEPTLKAAIEAGDCSEVSFQEEMQRRMESTVLTLKSGSYSQRVQAEFLKELESRSAAVFKSEAAE